MVLKRKTRLRTRWRQFANRRNAVSSRSSKKQLELTETERRVLKAVELRKKRGWNASRKAWLALWRDRDRLEAISTRKLLKPSLVVTVDFEDVIPDIQPRRQVRWCIYTTLFGAYDTLQPILNAPDGVDCICITDTDIKVEGWKTVVVPSGRGGVRGAKEYKILPHVFLKEYDASLFVDASTLIHGRIKDFIERWCIGYPFVMWRHSARCDLYDEADAILALRKAEPQGVIDQIVRYENAGVPKNSGLVEGGFIWRNHSDPDVQSFMEAWATETREGSPRDQLSIGFLMWKLQMRPRTFPASLGNIRQNCVSAIAAHRPMKSTLRPHLGMAGTVKKVVFLYEPEYLRSGSTVMRGGQLSKMLADRASDRYDVRFVSRQEDISDAIIILTKGCTIRMTPEELLSLKRINHGIIADFVDGEIRRDLLPAIDVVWASSISAFRNALLEPSFPDVDLVTHHVDPRLPSPTAARDYRAAYIGEPVNAVWNEEISSLVDLVYVNTKSANDDWLCEVIGYPLHYAIRPQHSGKVRIHKPFLKGFTAAHCDANIIISRDEGDAVSYLGEDYPYLTEGRTAADAIQALHHAKESFGSRTWQDGLSVMREVRERSSTRYIINEMRRSLSRFD